MTKHLASYYYWKWLRMATVWGLEQLEERFWISPRTDAHNEGWCDGMREAAKEVFHYLKDHSEMTPEDIRRALLARVSDWEDA